jgi:hypothetical protein
MDGICNICDAYAVDEKCIENNSELVRKPKGKSSYEGPEISLQDCIKVDLNKWARVARSV